jgi:hypothetical protein
MARRIALLFSFLLAATPVLTAGCSADPDEDDLDGSEDALTSVSDKEVTDAQAQSLGNKNFDSLTPAGTKIMKASLYWMDHQDETPRYPKPRMCASNVSKVFFLSEITQYDQEGVRNLIADVGKKGAEVSKMPQNKAGFIAALNKMHGGHIPAGTLVAGMSVKSANPGDQHIGFIGHTDADGTVCAYHNNCYRPENEGGKRKDFMISDANIKRGFLRQWMPTPWIKITRDASGTVTDVASLLPAIDDMDPFNPGYQVTLAIPDEVAKDLAKTAAPTAAK